MPILTPQFQAMVTPEVWASLLAQLDGDSNLHVIKAHTLTNVSGDAGMKIAAAIAMLPAGVGGMVDATGFPNPQTLSGFTITPGVTVLLGPIFHTCIGPNPIIINQGGRLFGMATNSPGATTLKLGDTLNRDVVKCISTAGESGWWHHGEMRAIRILGNKFNNTLGHGLSVYGLAETSLIQRVSISDAPQAGLYHKGSASGTGSIENVTVNANGLCGVQLDQFRSSILLKSVGGDQNPTTFLITDPSQGGGTIQLIDPKSEGAVGADPDTCVLIHGGSAKVNLLIQGGNFTTPGTDKTMIRVAADVVVNPGITIMGLSSGNGFTKLIDDLKNDVVVPTPPLTYHQFFAYCGGKFARFDETGFFIQA